MPRERETCICGFPVVAVGQVLEMHPEETLVVEYDMRDKMFHDQVDLVELSCLFR